MPTSKHPRRPAAVIAIAVLAPIAASTPTEAKIRCNGPWQIVKGQGQIATPYCGDNYLAKVAREFGFRVTGAQIRRNYEKKTEVCQLVGFDNRVDDICAGISDDHGRDSGR